MKDMIRVECDEFTIDVPIERRMSMEQFLSVAERLETLTGRGKSRVQHDSWHEPARHHIIPDEEHVFSKHSEKPLTPAQELRFEHEEAERLEYYMDRLAKQLTKLEETHNRLERLERTLLTHGIDPANH